MTESLEAALWLDACSVDDIWLGFSRPRAELFLEMSPTSSKAPTTRGNMSGDVQESFTWRQFLSNRFILSVYDHA
ncbi:hypothetical protein TNCV_3052391 [Trichonephila clavipes]|nr:hypothetical protein TNCV_3052391 [Trichonephila clavipes]